MPGIIVPRKTVLEVVKLFEGHDGDVDVSLSSSKIRFAANNLVLTSKLIDGTFPDYSRVIPTGNDKLLKLDPKSFWQGVDRVATIATEKTRAVKMALENDKITLSGPPRRVSLKAVSAPLATGLRRRKRTHSWQGFTLKKIAQDIADRAGLALDWSGDEGLAYKRREQKGKSDLEFLEEACKDAGRDWKVTEKAIVIFDERDREKSTSVGTIDLASSRVLGWHIDADDSARYGSCRITFSNPRKKKRTEHTYVDPTNPDGQTLDLRLPVDDKAHAEVVARGRLRDANRFANLADLTVQGDPGLVAGVVFRLKNAGGLSGRYIVTKATHRTTGGYTTSLTIRRCTEAY